MVGANRGVAQQAPARVGGKHRQRDQAAVHDQRAVRGDGRRGDRDQRRGTAPDVTAQYYDFPEPRRWINSGGLGTMGFGLPAAMGAAVGAPDRLVWWIAGEGAV